MLSQPQSRVTASASASSSALLDRKIEEWTAGLAASTTKRMYSISRDNAATIVQYLEAMKIEVNLSDHYRKDLIEFLSRFSKYNDNIPYNDQWVRDQMAECRKYNLHIEDRLFVVPVPFSVEGAKMLQHTKWLLEEKEEDGSSLIAMHQSFDKLLTALRTAVANEYKLDKTEPSYDDILDAFRLSLTFYRRRKGWTN
jgi:hypothetical protein